MSEVIEVKTIAEVERIVHASGEWDGTTPVEFSNDGESWRETWSPTAEHPHPEFARVTVHRKGVTVPTRVTIRWDEQVPSATNPDAQLWAAKWVASPMRHFGRTVRMVAFRQTFRELLGNIVLEDEDRATSHETPTTGDRDFAAEFEAAASVAELDEIVKAARAAKVFKPNAEGTALDRQWKARRKVLVAEEWAPVAVTPERAAEVLRVGAQIAPVVDDAIAATEAADAAPVAVLTRPAPQDHLPPSGNRADQRVAARKKGRRR